MVAVADATLRPEFAAFEIAAALTLTRRGAEADVALAHDIVRRLPAVHAAMASGDLSLAKARVISDCVSTLDTTSARRVVADILPRAFGLTTGELRARLAKLVIEADPETAAKRYRRRVRGRRVEFQPAGDSCANIFGLDLPAASALAASNRLTALAKSRKQAGEAGTMDQLRADTFLDLLMGTQAGATIDRLDQAATNAPATGTAGSGSTRAATPTDPTGQHPNRPAGTARNSGTQRAIPRRHHNTPDDATTPPSRPPSRSDIKHAASGPAGPPASAAERNGTRRATTPTGPSGIRRATTTRRRRPRRTTTAAPPIPTGPTGPLPAGARHGGVELVASLETLTRLAEKPGHLNGYGPVIADIARQVAQQQQRATWTFTIHDEIADRIITGTTRRRPTAAQARHVRSRDRTCRAPGCRRPALYADLDHTIAYEKGGRTIVANLGPLCRYHHRAKHGGGWTLIQPKPGIFIWRSPLGRRYTIKPQAP